MENAKDERGSSRTLLSARFIASVHNSLVLWIQPNCTPCTRMVAR